MSTPPAQTIYLDGAGEPVCAIFHPPAAHFARDTAVILCPPFGWDEVCSYRSRREWAKRLAADGYGAIRVSFPGTGDSGGSPRDPDRLDAWTASVSAAGSWLRVATGARRIVAIGMGLGGLVAYRAAATGGAVDDLVLWSTPARAGAMIRELRTFSRLERAQFFDGHEQPPPLPTGQLEAGGFLLTAQTVAELEQLELTALPLPNASARRILMLDRDGIAADPQLHDQLEGWGVAVSLDSGSGYAAMTSHPQQARAPHEVIERVTRWLGETAGAARVRPTLGHASDSAELQVGGDGEVKETPVAIEQPFGALSAVLTEPLGTRELGLCVVLLNAGAVRRIGPSRMWVEAARRWAAAGVPTLRLDVEGIGDADGDETPYAEDAGLYVPELVPQVLSALDFLQERGVGERFVLGGLCAGAYWAFHSALLDPRVASALMVNPRALIWDPGLAPARDLRALISRPSWSRIRRAAASGRGRELARWMLASPGRRAAQLRARAEATPHRLDQALDQLHATGKRALLLFADGEPLDDELRRSGRMARIERWSTVTVERIRVRDHTLRPNWAQAQFHEILDRALARERSSAQLREPATRLTA
ncbi:MAG: hypothetical protein JO206_08770 [Solirubrobacterales bacterium]|nr:hypothetical protein [Solirubrobacterales bacterium]MBV9473049.1 hypothetical protein [Solirubrobacterales bacterium]